ncbi:hypothetical protein [Kitasatospora sp. NPDC058478]
MTDTTAPEPGETAATAPATALTPREIALYTLLAIADVAFSFADVLHNSR